MLARLGKVLLLLIGVALVFAAVSAGLFQVMPSPLGKMDYLVIGTLATFASLLVLFLVLIKTWVKAPDLFFKRRKR